LANEFVKAHRRQAFASRLPAPTNDQNVQLLNHSTCYDIQYVLLMKFFSTEKLKKEGNDILVLHALYRTWRFTMLVSL